MDDQLSLFGAQLPEPASVGRAAIPPDLLQLAARLPGDLRLGTSSWYFPGWKDIVFDRDISEQTASRDGLTPYSRHPLLRTVGIDRSYYLPLSKAQFADYGAQVPEDFRFLVKAPAEITSTFLRGPKGLIRSRNFLDPAFAIEQFIDPCTAGLGEKCGVLLFQFSPLGQAVAGNPDLFANQLYRFLRALPNGSMYAVEVRDASLLVERFFKALDAGGARYCVGVHPRMPNAARQIEMARAMKAGPFVARWNLHSGFAYEQAKSRYAPFNKLVDEDLETREALASGCAIALRQHQPVFLIINNKAEGSAPLSAFKLAAAIAAKIATPGDV